MEGLEGWMGAGVQRGGRHGRRRSGGPCSHELDASYGKARAPKSGCGSELQPDRRRAS